MNDTGLVLEGGGMRGVYTAGVLEYFLEQKFYLPYVIGVSAGACNAASYLSRQQGRNKRVTIGFSKHPDYISLRNYWRKRQLFGMDLIFDEIPNKLVPFDYSALQNAPEKFVVGTTDCITGEPVYFEKNEFPDQILPILRASSSLPFMAPVIELGNRCLMDGGISDPIPIRKSEMDGNKKNIVILTRNDGYIKKRSKMNWITKKVYPQYGGLVKSMDERYQVYNETMSYITEKERAGEVYVIRPMQPLKVSRAERNPVKLTALYEQGYSDAAHHFDALKHWLSNTNEKEKQTVQ
ncbi:patatin-like phospholipase family protein [Pseudalkalibacillus berkeleyi]|uniref:Patatin family protein n=1 Tax=Pseudalkalibacillus berkeleyi TaxID=1069813 RepID=A0ABS9GY54_9BACL|nr:patatin family protein [Pseudalkalibacillus berkeleyi]MCF6136315.1 patatin family protein [Pseudalkalibacillus berkeleyi]